MINEILVNIDYLYNCFYILDNLENIEEEKDITLIFYKVFTTKQYEEVKIFVDVLKSKYSCYNFDLIIVFQSDNSNFKCKFNLDHSITHCLYISQNNKYTKEYLYYYNLIKNIMTNNYNNLFLLLDYEPVLNETKEHLSHFLAETSINISICRKNKYSKLYLDFVKDIQNTLLEKGYNGIFKPIMNYLYNFKENDTSIIYCQDFDENMFKDYIIEPLKVEVNNKVCAINTNFNNSLVFRKKDYMIMNRFMEFWNEKRINKIQNHLRRRPYIKNNIEKVDITFIYLNRINSLTTLYFPSFSLHTLSSFLNSNGYSSKVFECTEENIIQIIEQEIKMK